MIYKPNLKQDIVRQQVNLEKWTNLKTMPLNVEKHRETSSDATRSGTSISIMKTVKILIAKGGCYV